MTDEPRSGRYNLQAGYVLGRQSDFSKRIGLPGGTCIPNWWPADPDIYRAENHIFRLEEGYFFPRLGLICGLDGQVARSTYAEAAILVPSLDMLPYASVNADAAIRLDLPQEIAHLSCINVTLPWGGTSNYGHFVLDCLPAIGILLEAGLNQREFVFPQLAEWQRRHLQYLAVTPKELTDEIYRVTDVVFTGCMDHMLHSSNTAILGVRDRQKASRGMQPVATPSKIYLSRRGNKNREYRDEKNLEATLADAGFEVVDPQSMTLDNQINVFANADVIVGFSGAAFANVLYCKPNTEIIEIQSSIQGGIWVRNLAILVGCRWRAFFCEGEPLEIDLVINGVLRPGLGGYATLDIDLLKQYIMTAISRNENSAPTVGLRA